MSLAAIYQSVRHHQHHVEQYRCLLRLGQEHYPYSRALELAKPGDRLLDWGCGNGHLSYFLARHGFSVDAYDATKGNFGGGTQPPLLRDVPGVTFTLGDSPVALPYPSATFDLILGSGVLEHVHEFGGNQAASVAELSRVLKVGGLLWIYHLPNKLSWNENARALLTKLGLGHHAVHSAQYTRADFAALLRGSGLAIVEATRYHLLPRIALERLPRPVVDSPAFCSAFNAMDDALAFLLNPIAQNWSFLMRKLP